MPNGVMSQMESMINLRYLKKPHMNMANSGASIKLTIVNNACGAPEKQYGGAHLIN
jgi:hypothetical protein